MPPLNVRGNCWLLRRRWLQNAYDRRFARRSRFFKNIQSSEEDTYARNLEDDVSSHDDVVSYNSHTWQFFVKKMKLRTIVLRRIGHSIRSIVCKE